MFTHPAYASNPRRAYGELTGWQFYPITLPKGFNLTPEQVAAWRGRGAPLENGGFPNNSVVLVQTSAPFIGGYEIVWMNGKDLGPLGKLSVGYALRPSGLGDRTASSNFEDLLEKYAKTSFEDRGPALQEATRLWASFSEGQSEPEKSDASTSKTDTSSDEEVDALLAKTGGYDTAAAAAEKPKTGYYTDSGGYAWYYNAEKDYMEAVAAPKGKFSTQPRFDASKDASKYASMKGVLTADALTTRASAVSNAASNGGVELPAVAVGRSSPASTPPADVAARGEQKQDEKKTLVKGGFKGAVSAVPTWAWITLGTLTAAGGGYFVYRRFYKK
jgi:hypothetical protein